MSDLSELMKYAPTVGAGFAGINQAQNEQMQHAKMAELQQLIQSRMMESEQKAAMHPLELEHKRLANQTSTAQLPGLTADSESKRLKAMREGATYDADVDADITDKRMKAYKTLGTSLGSISSAIDGNPNIPPHVALAQEMQRLGIPAGGAQRIMQKYQGVPANELSRRMKEDAERMLRENSAYAQAMDQERMQQQGATQRTGMQVKGQKEIEQMRIDAGKYNRTSAIKSVEDRLLRAKNAKEKAEILESAYYEARDKDPELAGVLLSRAQEARQRAAEDARNQGTARPGIDGAAVAGLPAAPAPTATAPIGGSGGNSAKPSGNAGRIAVISPDGKRGSVPADQLEQALKQGYKKAQ